MQQSLVRTAIWAVALVCAALILVNGGARRRTDVDPGGIARLESAILADTY